MRIRAPAFRLLCCLAAAVVATPHGDTSPAARNSENQELEPNFGGIIENVTVAKGREARLSCIVESLGEYKVKESDRGCYMCQINTSIMKKQEGCIDVHVPPEIEDDQTSRDVRVGEGGSVTLLCVAKGYPAPEITWRRDDSEKIILKSGRSGKKEKSKVEEVSGPFLNLTRINRRQMGAYNCIAKNSVPPAVMKRIMVEVEYVVTLVSVGQEHKHHISRLEVQPNIEVQTQLVGAPLGSDLLLECHVEAWPRPITFWRKVDDANVILDGIKHEVGEVHDGYRSSMTLLIRRLEQKDFGTYVCAARNSINTAERQIRTYKILRPTMIPSSAVSTQPYSNGEARKPSTDVISSGLHNKKYEEWREKTQTPSNTNKEKKNKIQNSFEKILNNLSISDSTAAVGNTLLLEMFWCCFWIILVL